MQRQQRQQQLEDRQLGATQSEARHIIGHVLKGLVAVHAARIIHRDIKKGELQTAMLSGCPGSNTMCSWSYCVITWQRQLAQSHVCRSERYPWAGRGSRVELHGVF
jgi:serine/threonine protein kinase